MNKSIKRIWNLITSVLVAAILVLALLLAGARIIGLQVFTVLSGSMEPAYPVGSLIYVKKTKAADLKIDDVITYMLNEDTVATHRIVGVVSDQNDPGVIRFRTKGDANDTEDGTLVHYKNVVGTPVFTVPHLGYIADYISKPPGTYMAISGGAILLLLLFIPDLLGSKENDKKGKKEKIP